ncbi:MAG: glucosyltransferase domain-containing protein [Treponema sp.]|nr:glucosyltransferase domain-containing protein [Treponema sp.]
MKENKTSAIKYFSMEKVAVTGFCDFCKNNIPLVIAVSVTLFFTYGIRLFWYSIGIDTELFMADKSGYLKYTVTIGRFGYALLSKLCYIKEFNPFTAFFVAFCLIWFFTISWCYIIAVFSGDTVKNNKLIPFALVFMTMPVWAEQFYFLLQASENALIISLCPYIIYLLFKGFLDHEKWKIVCAFFLLVLITSVYQAVIPLFCCGVFACFVLFQEQSGYEPKVYRHLCLKIFITLVGAVTVYFFIDRIIIPVFFHIERSAYLDSMNKWGKRPIRENIMNILSFGYLLTIGKIPIVQNIVYPIITGHTEDISAIELLAQRSRIFGNVLLLPAVVFFLVEITRVMRKTIPAGRKLLYVLAGIGIPLCIIILAVMGGDRPVIRSLYVLPLASAFMFFYLIRTYKKKAAVIVTCLALFVAVYQAEITAQLFYSDQIRYNEDVRFAHELNKLITQVQPVNEKLPVVLVGRYQPALRFHTNFIQGQAVGRSFFEWNYLLPGSSTERGLTFMKSLGINFDMPDEIRIEQAFKEAASMPHYPDPGCVKRMQDFIVVRISETMYGYE